MDPKQIITNELVNRKTLHKIMVKKRKGKKKVKRVFFNPMEETNKFRDKNDKKKKKARKAAAKSRKING